VLGGDQYSGHRVAPQASVAELSAVLAAGIDFRVVRTWPGTDRQFDRELHVCHRPRFYSAPSWSRPPSVVDTTLQLRLPLA
jgi:hypothetical protein